MSIIERLKGLFKHKEESIEMSEPLNTATNENAQPVAVNVESKTSTPADEVKAGVQNFEAALSFVESGVAQLGAAAKDELKALAKKYL